MKRSEAIAAVEAAVQAAQEAGVSFTELQEAVGWGAFQGGSIENRDRIEGFIDQRDHECADQCPDPEDHTVVQNLGEQNDELKELARALLEVVAEAEGVYGELKEKAKAMEAKSA